MSTFSPRNQKGFSLVELMVVVAIIGILASIAIPSLQKYMAKARQSEAKTSLASLYTAEKAFFAEYNTYTTDFTAIGYQPEGQLRYSTGYNGAGASGASTYLATYGFTYPPSGVPTYSTSTACDAAGTSPQTKTCIMTAEADPTGLSGTDADSSTFTAKASSKIYKSASDVWSMNENKNLANSVPGIN